MPRISRILTVREVKGLPLGKHPVGGVTGLYVDKTKSGSQYYLRWRMGQKNYQKYLPKSFTLAEAREMALSWRKLIEQGINPKEELDRKKQLDALQNSSLQQLNKERQATFETAYKLFRQYQQKVHRWANNPRDELRQDQKVNKYLMPYFADIPLKEISMQDVAKVLTGIYSTYKASTAQKIITILKQLYNWANMEGFGNLDGYTPMGETLNAFIRPAKINCKPAQNLPSLPYQQIPDFIKEVAAYHTMAARLVIFSILTVARSKACRCMKRSDINFTEGVYYIRSENNKVKNVSEEQRRIFLAKPVLDWLQRLPVAGDYVFSFRSDGKPVDASVPDRFIKNLHLKKYAIDGIGWIDPVIKDDNGNPKRITLHGTARATFRTWCADVDGAKHRSFNRDAVEFNLLHFNSAMGRIERAYNRATLDKERREIMEAWAQYCLSKTSLLP